MAFKRCLWGALATVILATGCGRKSSLLLERRARGPVEDVSQVAQSRIWVLEPVTQTQSQDGIEVSVTHASPAFLREFFSREEIFGPLAGQVPYFLEQMVFYVRIANTSGQRIRIDPSEFVLTDDQGNQYHVLHPDYTTALAEAKAPFSTATRGVLQEARPGYFGLSLPVGKLMGGGSSQRRFGLLAMSTLKEGYLYDGVVYDGLVAFWNPSAEAAQVTLRLTDIKTDFNASDLAQRALEFTFRFTARTRAS